jgi:hypothetical protein
VSFTFSAPSAAGAQGEENRPSTNASNAPSHCRAVQSLSADMHLNALNNSYDRLYLWARSVEMGS